LLTDEKTGVSGTYKGDKTMKELIEESRKTMENR
jgi:hypothetical protein